jgi:hypothetical protein
MSGSPFSLQVRFTTVQGSATAIFISAKMRALSITLVPLAAAVARAAAFHGTVVLITQKMAAAVWSAVQTPPTALSS